jgi:hypothetical protein
MENRLTNKTVAFCSTSFAQRASLEAEQGPRLIGSHKGSRPLPPPAPAGLRGVAVVQRAGALRAREELV